MKTSMSKIQWEYDVVEKPAWDKTCRGGFAQKILGGHRPPLQLGVRNCRGALLSADNTAICEIAGGHRRHP